MKEYDFSGILRNFVAVCAFFRFQRWDRSQTCPSPGGTAESAAFQASLRDASATTPTPSVETPGYFRMSLRDRAAGRASQILVALAEPVRAPANKLVANPGVLS